MCVMDSKMTETTESKIKTYENFIETTLKPDLREVEKNLAECADELAGWKDVKRTATLFAAHEKHAEHLDVNLFVPTLRVGEREVLAKVEVPRKDRMYVAIGCGCLLDMDLEEADRYADIRLRFVGRRIEHFRKLAVKIKANIKLTLLAINELRTNTVAV